MTRSEPIRVAVLADIHFHALDGPFAAGGFHIGDGRRIFARTLADTVRSTRVFNETGAALRAVLDDLVRDGIRHVVIAGDVSDDGQRRTMDAIVSLLDRYRRKHGFRFYLTIGNHDVGAPFGTVQAKWFLEDGGGSALVAGGPPGASLPDGSIEDPGMAGLGYADALAAFDFAGFFPQSGDCLWETPFGTDPNLDARTVGIRSPDGLTERRMIDASYLVEPVPGLWVLSIDANVYRPRIEASGDADPAGYEGSTDAGWNAMPAAKPRVLAWVADVVARARREGKRLLAFSHYPMADFLAGNHVDECTLFGVTGFARRSPTAETQDALARTDLSLHFSGHLHVDAVGVARSGTQRLVNVAVGSFGAYPPTYKRLEIGSEGIRVETVRVPGAPGFDVAFPAYRAECTALGLPEPPMLGANDYWTFLDRHLEALVAARYLPDEWPAYLAEAVRGQSLGTLLAIAGVDVGDLRPAAEAVPGLVFVTDWYRLRQAGALAFGDIGPERLALYRATCRPDIAPASDDPVGAGVAILLRMMGRMLAADNAEPLVVPHATRPRGSGVLTELQPRLIS